MLIENVRIAFASMAANKLRTFLTMLGIIIGIAAVITIMTVGNSITRQNEKDMSVFGVNTMNVYMWFREDAQNEEVTVPGDMIPKFTQDMMTKMVNHFRDEIEAVSVTVWLDDGRATLPDGDEEKQYANVSVQGANPGYFTVNKATNPIIEGRAFSKDSLGKDDYDCVVSDRLVKNLFDGDAKKALGKKINIRTNKLDNAYTIVGVYKDALSSMNGMGDPTVSEKDVTTAVMVPFQNAVSLSEDPNASTLQNFDVSAKAGTDVMSFSTDLQSYLQSLLPEDSQYEINVYTNQEMIEETRKTLQQLTLAVTAIGAIALLVGGIGVMNIMTVSITERTREIGTRKALGAPRRAIRGQFITEAVIMSITGGLIGTVLGVLAGFVACHVIKMPMYVSLQSILVSFLFSFGIGVFFGFYPANKASKMDPIDALRYDS